jgi:hypothetical protein
MKVDAKSFSEAQLFISKICNCIAGPYELHDKPANTARFHRSFAAVGGRSKAGHALSSKKLRNEVTLPLMPLQ